jgi:anti-sigma-K factor RskA
VANFFPMTSSALPENWRELMAGYTLGDLSPEEAEEFQRVLAENPDITSEVSRLQEVLGLMPYALPDQEPPPHLRAAILNAAQLNEPEAESVLIDRVAVKRRRNFTWLGIGAAAAATILALAVNNYRLQQEVQTARQEVQKRDAAIATLEQEAQNNKAVIATLQQPNASLYALQGTNQAATAAGNLVLAPTQREVVIVAHNLPKLPEGKAYRLWAVATGATKPTYCGQFNSSPTGIISATWSVPTATCSSNVSQLLITAETASDPPIPAGPLVMKSKTG